MCAKVTGPLMSVTASGKFANTIVASNWKGRQYMRLRVIPANPQSAGQQAVRAALAAAGRSNAQVIATSDVEVSAIAEAPSDQSWAGYLASLMIERYTQSDTDYNDAGNATVAGYFDDSAATLGMNDITIPGASPVVIPAGLILWNLYQSVNYFDSTSAPSIATAASEANLVTFLAALAAA